MLTYTDNTVTFDGVIFQIPKKSPYRSYANKRIDVHVGLDGSVEFFYKTEKIAAFDSTTTHAFGLYRTQKKRAGFATDPFLISLTNASNSHPDIFTLLLT